MPRRNKGAVRWGGTEWRISTYLGKRASMANVGIAGIVCDFKVDTNTPEVTILTD